MKKYFIKLYLTPIYNPNNFNSNTQYQSKITIGKLFSTKKEAFLHGRQCLKGIIECEMHCLKNENNNYDNDYFLYLEHTLTLLNNNKKIMSFENQRGIFPKIESFKVFSKKVKKTVDN